MIMKIKSSATLVYALALVSGVALASGEKVTINSPHDGAAFKSTDTVELMYEAQPGTDGDHLHLYLDEKRIDVIRPLKGTASVGMLMPGKHHICLTVNTKGHAPTGAEACIDVTAQ